MSDDQLVACQEYAKSFNQLDASHLISLLADDVTYSSHWVFETMHGRDRVAAYLEDKIQAIKKSSSQVVMDIAQCSSGYAVVAFQQQDSTDASWLEKPQAVMLIETRHDGLVTSMHMTDYALGHVEKCLHVYPGWAGQSSLAPNDRMVLTQSDYRELELYVLLLDGKIPLDQRMLEEVEIVRSFLPGITIYEHVFQTLMDDHVSRLIMKSSINRFPALIAIVRGHIVWQTTGLLKSEEIAKRLQQVLSVRRAAS